MAKIPSIALIPSGVKATKVYSQLPVDGGGDFTFNRGTSTDQTRVNKDGLIENVAQDVPRLDYLDGGCPSLLLEPASTNLITYSEDITNAAWSKPSGGTGSTPIITANFSLSPKGDLTADRVQLALNGGVTVSDFSIVRQNVSVSSGVTTARSIYVKSANGSTQNIVMWDSFDLGVFVDVEVTNEWKRIELVGSAVGTSSGISIGLRNFSGGALDDSADILLWGAQLEEKSYATSYIPTSGSTAPRAAETCNSAGSTAEINSQEGVLYAEIRALANDGTNRVISLSDGSTSNRASVFYKSSNNTIRYQYIVGGSAQCGIEITLPSSLNYSKVAIYYKENDFRMYVNGLLVDLDLSGSVLGSGVLNELSFFAGGTALPFYGRVKKLSVYDSALSDSELETLTGFGSFAEMASYLSYS